MRAIVCIISYLGLCMLIGCAAQQSTPRSVGNYVERWSGFQTRLIRKEKTFQEAARLDVTGLPYRRIEYESDGMTLQALLDTRNIEQNARKPAVVYLHGGFALRLAELEVTEAFTDAGFVVLAPGLYRSTAPTCS